MKNINIVEKYDKIEGKVIRNLVFELDFFVKSFKKTWKKWETLDKKYSPPSICFVWQKYYSIEACVQKIF